MTLGSGTGTGVGTGTGLPGPPRQRLLIAARSASNAACVSGEWGPQHLSIRSRSARAFRQESSP